MKERIILVVGALVTLAHCGGQATTGSNVDSPDASASSSGGGSGGGSSSGTSSGASSSSGAGSSGGTSSGGSSSGGSSSGGPSDAGCLGLSSFDGGPRGTPSQHRPQATACAPSTDHLPCEVIDGGGGQVCSTDADCAGDGSFNPYSSCLHGHCDIDQCLADSDCPSTQLCSCSSDYYGGNACYHPNLCVPANCHVDSDCGPGGFCSPTAGYCGTVEGFYCHKATDPCFLPTDCGGGTGSSASCIYSTAVGAFCCGQAGCSG